VGDTGPYFAVTDGTTPSDVPARARLVGLTRRGVRSYGAVAGR